MRTLAVLVAVGILSTCSLWANGGAWRTGVASTGNGSATNEGHSTEVTIEEENLTIDLHQEFADVEVRYRMHNTGSGVKQDFFFPVEAPSGNWISYQVTANGRELKWEDVAAAEEKPQKGAMSAVEAFGGKPFIKSWKKSRIPFSRNQEQEVVVRFKAPYRQESFSISEHSNAAPTIFAYSLSPAATWKGPISKGKVTINILHPEPQEVTINKQRFAKVTDTRYEWTFQDLKPTLDDDIQIIAHQGYESFPVSYAVGESSKANFPGEYQLYKDRYYLLHTAYDVTASSTLKPEDGLTYEIDHIKTRSHEYTWAEGVQGDGIGENIALTVKKPLPLDAILILPGYDTNNEQYWWKNNRVAQLEITLNGEYTFTAAIPDERFRNPYPIPVRGYSKPVTSIKLVIKGVYRGTAYQDTCISSVQLRAKLAKQPKMGPCR